jgi:hypothetical protein
MEPSFDGPATVAPRVSIKTAPHLIVESSAPSARTISEIYDRFIADPRHPWSKRTAIAHITTRKWIAEAIGAETPITEITREGCREFVDLLRHLPRHADKRFPGMEIRKAVAAAKARGERRLINAANVNAYINRFGGVLN